MKEAVRARLACPECRVGVQRSDDAAICTVCGARYPVVRGVPMMFGPRSQAVQAAGQDYYDEEIVSTSHGEEGGGSGRLKRILKTYPDTLLRPTPHDKAMDQYLVKAPESKIILNVGSGTAKVFAQPNLVNLDIYPHLNTDVGGDAHYLPFLAACRRKGFDAHIL